MEVTALCIKLLMIVTMLLFGHDKKVNAASLLIHPNKTQFFEYESLTFYCQRVFYCEVVHESKGKIASCIKTNKRTSTGSSCTVTNAYTEDSGEYWFEAGRSKRSNIVNIVVTNGSVILEIPALPVMEGEAVTLTCRNKTTSSQNTADFFRNGVFINSSSTGNMSIYSVSKSDEGLYKCSISGAGESAESRLTVRSRESQHPKSKTPSSDSTPWIIATVLLVILLLVLGLYRFVKDDWNKVSESVDSAVTSTPATYAVVMKNRRKQDEDESSCRPLYHMLDLDATHQLGF
ncbi:high affinity immunoglobulin gamma Fc receptor I-like [Anabas testudineus]|uniref:high affinity immunoglobulin gamma Fc receptor I-like n=1 Tax=Anabas testudineus TaxID=64144 RepID=UPI000E45FB12|nr:high affinity immunoglobulin gamma Fc receptor I-like [Anabas testudineus]